MWCRGAGAEAGAALVHADINHNALLPFRRYRPADPAGGIAAGDSVTLEWAANPRSWFLSDADIDARCVSGERRIQERGPVPARVLRAFWCTRVYE